MSKTILQSHNFQAGRLNILTLTIQQCFDLYRHYYNEYLTPQRFCEECHMSIDDFLRIQEIHSHIENKIINDNKNEEIAA